MSEEPAKDVSPLRLKRPGSVPSGAPPSGAPESTPPAEASASPAAEPVWPTPPPPSGLFPAAPSEPQVPGGDLLIGGLPSEAPPPARKRPSLALDKAELPESKPVQAEEPVPPAPIKLRVGAKPPPPSSAKSAENLPDDLFPADTGAPLVPLPGMPMPGAPAAGRPAFPPFPPPPPPTPPTGGGRPPGTVPISAGASPQAEPGVAALMPLPLTGGTRPPMAVTPPAMPPAQAQTKSKAPKARRDLLIFLLVFVLLAAVGGGAYWFFTKPGDASANALAEVREKIERVAEMPGKAVEGAKESISGARAGEQDRVDSVLEGRDTPDRTGVGAVSPAELEARLKADVAPVAPTAPGAGTDKAYSGIDGQAGGVSADSVSAVPSEKPAEPAPVASARLVRYADGLSVSGVFQGTPARALVNGRLIREGDVVDAALGIRFVGVDATTKHLLLEEASGARVRVKY